MLTKRLEILFDPTEYEVIKEKAKEEGKSIARLVRETLKEKLIDKGIKQKERALERLLSLGPEKPFSEWQEEKKEMTRARVKEIETH